MPIQFKDEKQQGKSGMKQEIFLSKQKASNKSSKSTKKFVNVNWQCGT